jgi:thiol-disulfide isomerase/thioredoxin
MAFATANMEAALMWTKAARNAVASLFVAISAAAMCVLVTPSVFADEAPAPGPKEPAKMDAPAVHPGFPKPRGSMENFTYVRVIGPRPDITWTDDFGHPVGLSKFEGKVVLVNFWATWCKPCGEELPTLEKLKSAFGDWEFAAVAVNTDRSGRGVASRMLRHLGMRDFDIYLDRNENAADAFGVKTLPTSFLFDSKGREIGRMVGAADWNTPEAIELVRYFVDHPDYADQVSPGMTEKEPADAGDTAADTMESTEPDEAPPLRATSNDLEQLEPDRGGGLADSPMPPKAIDAPSDESTDELQ